MTPPRIYLDNAATSWPKPEGVYAAMDRYQREVGAAVGRGAYAPAAEAARLVSETRSLVSRLIGAEDPRRIVFTAGCTDSLNLAIHGVLREGDHVVTTVCEHNSVLRPLRQETDRHDVSVTYVNCDSRGTVDPDAVAMALQPDTRLICLVHVSNVTGAIQPLREIGRLAAERDCLLLVDAAQSLGHVPLDVTQNYIDLLAAPGHKGLLGPLGVGFFYVGPRAEGQLTPQRQGGTGGNSREDVQPQQLPARFEAGNLNVPGIVGLGAGVRWVLEKGLDELRRHDVSLTERLLAGVGDLPGVNIHGSGELSQRTGVVSLTVEGFSPQDAAGILDAQFGINARAGLHCAPRMHEALGTLAGGGTLRLSLGALSSEEHVDAAIDALGQITSA